MQAQVGPGAGQPAPGATATIVIDGAPGVPAQTISIPLSLADVRWLRARRSELEEQLSSTKERREGITDELYGEREGTRAPDGTIRAGLEQQVAILDQRIAQLESDIAQTERILTSAPSGFLATTEPPTTRGGEDDDAWVMIPVFFIAFVLFPLVYALTRRILRRAPAPQAALADASRLERIEQAVEAIAVEVERVSEGQRFVTRLMSESKVAAGLPASTRKD